MTLKELENVMNLMKKYNNVYLSYTDMDKSMCRKLEEKTLSEKIKQ